MKKFSIILIGFALLLGCSYYTREDFVEPGEIWTSERSSVCAWFDETDADDSMGINIDPMTIHVAKNAGGENIFSFVRLPMGTTLFGNEIEYARLYLKVAEGNSPSSLRVGLIKDLWGHGTTLSDAKIIMGDADTALVSVQQGGDGWISVDITNYVVKWLNKDAPNYGLVFLAEAEGTRVAFASDWDETSENPPVLEVAGAAGERELTYGKFAYIRRPGNKADDEKIKDDEPSNCLSYALRDTNMITDDDLSLDYDEMTRIRREAGEDAVANYCARHIMDYVEKHKTGLQISGFRQIDGFETEIDPDKEYRIALRIGSRLYDDEDTLNKDDGNFDYHLWAQLNNGQWAQKFMFVPTEIVPCSGPGIPPDKYPWDASPTWEIEAFNEFYTSKVIYFAVTKDTDGFTEHKE